MANNPIPAYALAHGLSKVTRVEIIDETGRRYVRHNLKVDPSLQDNGRTLKLFVQERGDKS